ncbi:MAG: alpha/beta hydrolase, partial [Fimbriimonas ginsengisoli]|nr:alpha/beta hydrolase [Fimbriimonas ginsengisoli]
MSEAFVHIFHRSPVEGARTLLMLHGTGGNESSLVSLGQALDPDASIISPRGQSLEEGVPRFFRRLSEGVFDLEDVERRAHELADWLEAFCAGNGLAPPYAVGFSNGANMGVHVRLARPEALAGVVAIRAQRVWRPEPLPSLDRKPVLILSGEQDPIVSRAEAEALASILREAGA